MEHESSILVLRFMSKQTRRIQTFGGWRLGWGAGGGCHVDSLCVCPVDSRGDHKQP